jgi:hypothetical protein
MKNVYKLSSLLLVALLVFQLSCSEDETPAPVDELVGNWQVSNAVFNSTSVEPTGVMVIENFPTTAPEPLQVPAGIAITDVVIGAIADGVCASPLEYGTSFLELTAEGQLFINCGSASELSGSWIRTEDPTLGTVITLNVSAGPTTVPISFSSYVMSADKNQFSGVTAGFPMVRDYNVDIGEPLNGGLNLQFLNLNMEFTRLQ